MPTSRHSINPGNPPSSPPRRVIDATAVETPPADFGLPVVAPSPLPAPLEPPKPGLRVDHDGGIHAEEGDGRGREPLAEVTPDVWAAQETEAARDHGDPVTVYTQAPTARPLTEVTDEVFAADVDKIRDAFFQAQRDGKFNRDNALHVGKEGQIFAGNEGNARQPLSAVTPDVWAAGPSVAEAQIVRKHFPTDTLHSSQLPVWPADQPDGWVTRTVTRTGDEFTYLCHRSPLHNQYRALLITPRLEVHINSDATPHDMHLYRDGTMCVTKDVGAPDLQTLYARAVIWCDGIAHMLRSNEPFPYNLNQAAL